jgi:hypothetical protein
LRILFRETSRVGSGVNTNAFNNNNNNNNNNNSIYLCVKLTAQRPITKLAQARKWEE